MKPLFVIAIVGLAAFLLSCMGDEPIKLPYNGFTPKSISDDWTLSSPEQEGMERSLVEAAYRLAYEDDRYVMARSLLVMRNGKLVAEAYPTDPEDINRAYNIQSCTKSFTSILAGIALHNHHLDSLNERLSDIYPEHFQKYPDKKNITLAHALSMKTGINFNNDEHTLELYQSEGSSVEIILSLQKIYEPGIVFSYNDGAPHLVSAAVQKKTGKPLSEYAAEFLFGPLNISEYLWEKTKDGINYGAVSLYLKPRDLAKIGQLLLQNGRWNNRQIVDSSWVAKATTIQATTNSGGASYGYYFWIYPSYGGYAAQGHGGQFLFVVPGKNLVVVYTAWPYTSGKFFDQYTEIMDLLIRSCI